MRIALMVAVGSLLAACGDAQADANTAGSDEAPAQQEAAESQTSWLAFSDRDKCELAPQAAQVVQAMALTSREGGPYAMLTVEPASASVPGESGQVEAVALADDPYQTPGVFLPLEEEWNGLPLRGLWVNAAAREALSENIPYDGVEIRLYFADAANLRQTLEQAGWQFSEVDAEYGEALPVTTFSQQYFLDSGKLLDEPIDFEAEARKSASGLPVVDGQEVGSYGMNTIVDLVESSAKPGMTYLTCNIYAST